MIGVFRDISQEKNGNKNKQNVKIRIKIVTNELSITSYKNVILGVLLMKFIKMSYLPLSNQY